MDGELLRRQQSAERALLHMGITFNVYGDSAGTERIFPFDLVPRIVAAAEWDWIERGLKQRIRALNLFIDDIYHEQTILKDGVVPADIVGTASSFRKQCVGLNPPRGIWCHITGTDLVRDGDGQIYVLEDNLRCPSGVSYVLQNRELMKRTFPAALRASRIRPVDDYPSRLLDMLESLSPDRRRVASRRRADARASTTRPTSSTRSSPSRWASSWSRAATWSCRTASSTCGRPRASSASTSSTAASTTTSSTRRRSAPIRCSACPA